MIKADEALALGMVAQVVADDEVAAEAAKLAQTLADGPTVAYGRIKTLLRDGQSRPFDEHVDAEAEAISASAAGAVGREGVAAFRVRRSPTFH